MTVYDSLLDVPLDTQDPADDGDDKVVPGVGVGFDAPVQRPPLMTSELIEEMAIAVPFFPLKKGNAGKPVRALNRALSKAGFRRWSPLFSLVFTVWVERSLKRFQKSRGLPQTGVYDRATHEKLARYYDAYGIKYLLQASIPQPTKDDLERAAFVAELMYLYNRRWQLPYTQRRPFDCRKPPSWGLDCSGAGEWAGEHSPIGSLSGFPGCGYGNTDSQIARYRALNRIRSTISQAKPGDPKYFGVGGDPSHVGYILGKDSNGTWRLWSNGSYPIKILDAYYRHDGIAICNLTGR